MKKLLLTYIFSLVILTGITIPLILISINNSKISLKNIVNVTLVPNNTLLQKVDDDLWEIEIQDKFEDYYFILIFYIIIVISTTIFTYIIYKKNKYAYIKDKFISYIFHEIRVPLNSVNIGLNYLETENSLNNDVIKKISYSIKQVNKILQDLLDLYRLERGGFEIEQEYFNITQSIMLSIDMFQYQADERGMNIIFINNHESNLFLYGDQVRILQVINNMISNAIKFGNENTEIIVESISNKYKINGKKYNNYELKVIDIGTSIKKENSKSIFKPYNRIKTNSKELSNGLGLSICKLIMDKHNGMISFISDEEKTCFNIKLTCLYLVRDLDLEKNDEIYLCNKNILIVDDNKNNCDLMKLLLEKYENKCEIQYSGPNCLEHLDNINSNYDILLLDNNMPSMSGIEVSKIIKNRYPHILIIMITGDSDIIMKKIKIPSIDDVISKPINFLELNNAYFNLKNNL